MRARRARSAWRHGVGMVCAPLTKRRVDFGPARVGVRMVSHGSKSIDGVMTSDGTVWKPTGPLGYAPTYTLTVTSCGTNGAESSQVSSFTTLRSSNQTKVSFTTTSEATLREGGTYGVGIVLVAHFDEQIADRAAAERQLVVTTDPAAPGSWFLVALTQVLGFGLEDAALCTTCTHSLVLCAQLAQASSSIHSGRELGSTVNACAGSDPRRLSAGPGIVRRMDR